MKRKISCCVVTSIQLSLTLDTTFCMLYKEGIYLYTQHNLSSAEFDSLSPSIKTGSQSEEGNKYINVLHIVVKYKVLMNIMHI